MPEAFETVLREGTEQFLSAVDPPTAAQLRALGEGRARQRQIRGIAWCAAGLLAVGATAAGALRLHASGDASAAASTRSSHQHSAAPMHTAASAAEPTGPVGVSIQGPQSYAAQTANTVRVTLTNPEAQRAVIVEFDTTGTGIFEWAEGCDAGTDGGCTSTNLADNPLQLTQGALGETTAKATRFSLTLPTGTHTYEAWVNPPSGASTFSVRVLDDRAQKVFGSAQSAPIVTGFPQLSLTSQASTSIVRGGGYVEFSATVSNRTGGGYIDLSQLGEVTCSADGSPVSVSANDYALQWNTTGSGAPSWANMVAGFGTGSMGYDLHAGESTTTRFRVKLKSSLPSQVTSCRVDLTVVNRVRTSPPYYTASDPQSHAIAEFTVR